MNIQIESSVTLGNLIGLLASLAAIAISTWRIVARLGRMEMKLNMLWAWFKKEHKITEEGEDQ